MTDGPKSRAAGRIAAAGAKRGSKVSFGDNQAADFCSLHSPI